ncbi:MAG: O-antigen ligase family protein [Gemmatimonadota bacterium]|nr:MAG: O-antigen ligase family protein [Gemmatimonadota bacterium]
MTSATYPATKRSGRARAVTAVRGVIPTFDPIRLGLFVLTVLTVSRVHQHFGFLAQLRPAMLLVALTLFFALLNPNELVRGSLLRTWPAKVVLALAIAACISVPSAIALGQSGRYVIESYSKVIVFAFLLIAATRSVRDLATFVWGYVVGCAVLSWLALFVFGLEQDDGATFRLNDLHTFDANDAGCVLMIGIALTLLLIQASKGHGRWMAALVLVAMGATLARTGSRGAFVAAIMLGVYLLVMLNNISIVKRLAFLSVVAAALVVSAPQGYWERMLTIARPTQDYNWSDVNGRVEVAKRGLRYMLDHPFTGVGISNFPVAEGTISEKARTRVAGTGIRWAAAHNTYVQIGAELGIPGLALWLILIFGGMLAMHRLRSRLPKTWIRGDPEERFLYLTALYLPVALVGFAAASFFVSFAYLDPIYIVAALMAGLYVSAEAKLKTLPQSAVPPAPGKGLARRIRNAQPAPTHS